MNIDTNQTLNQCVIFKTHIWNDDIEAYVNKLLTLLDSIKTHFWILLHDESGKLLHRIPDSLKAITISFTESMLKELYDSETFFGIHTSNHWIMMYFWKKFSFNQNYDYLWSMEYDVRISGDARIIFSLNSDEDFVYTMGFRRNPSNRYYNIYTGTNPNRFQGYVQLARYSKKALDTFDAEFSKKINGQDELIIYTLVHESNMKINGVFLKSFIKGEWTWDNSKSTLNKIIYNNYVEINKVAIFHPVK
jgi:hypothetical protein